MAPRIEKPTSRILKRGTPGFRHPEEKNWFERVFQNRKIMVERPLNPNAVAFDPILFQTGWRQALEQRRVCNATMVREFCASLMVVSGENREYEAYVRGTRVNFSPQVIAHTLGMQLLTVFDCPFYDEAPSPDEIASELTNGAISVWVGKRISMNMLTRYYQVLFLIFVNAIIPTTFKSAFDYDTAKIIYALGTRQQVSLPHILYESIIPPTVAKGVALKCGGLISKICMEANVPVKASDEIIYPRSDFGAVSLKRSRAQFEGLSKRQQEAERAAQEEEGEESGEEGEEDRQNSEGHEQEGGEEQSEEEEEEVEHRVTVDYSLPENSERRSKRAEERPSALEPLRDLLGQVIEGQRATNMRLMRLEIDQQATSSHVLDIQRHLAKMGMAPPTRRRSY